MQGTWGLGTDLPVPGDYQDVGSAQLATVAPAGSDQEDWLIDEPVSIKNIEQSIIDRGFADTKLFGFLDDLGFATMIRVPGYGEHLAATTDPDIVERAAAAFRGFRDAQVFALVPGLAPLP